MLGLVDGIINALTLAAGSILHGHLGVGLGLALRIGCFAFATGWFVLFISDYVGLRADLVRAARQLNLTEHGQLATTQLGRAVRREALADATIGGIASFAGSLVPLLAAGAMPRYSWVAIVIAVGMLAVLGIGLARTVYGRPSVWAVALAVGGVLLTVVGLQLQIA